MKKAIKITLFAAVICSFAACKKDRNTDQAEPQNSEQMRAVLNSTTDKVKGLQLTNDPDVDFAMVMQTQQQGVIDIANLELKNGSDNYLKEKAAAIIKKNQEVVNQLIAYLNNNPAQVKDLQFDALLLLNKAGTISQADFNGKIDHDFAMLMIGLHQSGIDVSKMELLYGHQEDIIKMANKLIPEHQTEVKELEDWLMAQQAE